MRLLTGVICVWATAGLEKKARWLTAAGIGGAGLAALGAYRLGKQAPSDETAAADAPAGARPSMFTIARADALFRQRTVSSCEAAAALYQTELAKDPTSLDLKLKAADALNAAMRIATKSNTITIDGTMDTPAHKKIWQKSGPRALELAEAVYKKRPNDARVLAVYADAFMFASSYKGLVKQALTGTGTQYKAIAQRLHDKFPRTDSDVGSAILACFYHVAPWPVGSQKKALKSAKDAVASAPSMRNLYYEAVISYAQGDESAAKLAFQKALKAKPGSITEQDFAPFMLAESKRALKILDTRQPPV